MADSVVLLSGGVDSATLVASLTEASNEVSGLFIDYGQSASRDEELAAQAIAAHYEVALRVLKITGLSFGPGEIRGRNAFLLHTALMAIPLRPTVLTIGIHGGVPYVDCGEAFLDIHRQSFALHTDGEVQLSAPFLAMSKGDVLQLARQLSVPVELTYSCERGGAPCEECLSCLDRAYLGAIT